MSRTLLTIRGIQVNQDDDGRVHWISGAAVDADGANGLSKDEHGKPIFAYKPDDTGLDYLANAGYPHNPLDYPDILCCNGQGKPIVVGGGFISMTAYKRSHPELLLQERWLDAAGVSYAVVNPLVRRYARGIVLGCKVRLTFAGVTIDAVAGDVSGAKDIGEVSYCAAKRLKFPNPSPRNGGVDGHVLFEMWPNVPAVVDGEQFELQRA